MTWIIGGASLFGYGVAISDVEVRFASGETKPMVQKAYLVGNSLVGGFAGSVLIGFRLLENLVLNLRLPKEQQETHAWDPRVVAREWAPIAKRIFESSPKTERDLGSQFLLVGVSPTENRGTPDFPVIYMVRFVYPEFRAGFIRKHQVFCSIGSGTSVRYYMQHLRPAFGIHSSLHRMESGVPGGWGQALAYSMSRLIAKRPTPGISRNLHVLGVGHQRRWIFTNDETIWHRDGREVKIQMPPVAQSYREFQAMASRAAVDATGALC